MRSEFPGQHSALIMDEHPDPRARLNLFLNIYSSSASVAFVGRESTYFGKKAPPFLKQEFQDLPKKFHKPLV